MAADIDIALLEGLGRIRQILHRITLGRQLRHKAHVKIFLPADDGIVRTPEGDNDVAGREQKGHCAELLLLGNIDRIDKAAYLKLRESGTLGNEFGQPVIALVQILTVSLLFPLGSLCRRLFPGTFFDTGNMFLNFFDGTPEISPLPEALIHDPVKRQIGKCREYNVIHFAHFQFGKTDVSAPVQIIINITHIRFPTDLPGPRSSAGSKQKTNQNNYILNYFICTERYA